MWQGILSGTQLKVISGPCHASSRERLAPMAATVARLPRRRSRPGCGRGLLARRRAASHLAPGFARDDVHPARGRRADRAFRERLDTGVAADRAWPALMTALMIATEIAQAANPRAHRRQHRRHHVARPRLHRDEHAAGDHVVRDGARSCGRWRRARARRFCSSPSPARCAGWSSMGAVHYANGAASMAVYLVRLTAMPFLGGNPLSIFHCERAVARLLAADGGAVRQHQLSDTRQDAPGSRTNARTTADRRAPARRRRSS